jgi:hypothetical protein
MEKFTGATVRSKVLRALGILGQQDYKDLNRLWKDSRGYEKAPHTPNPLKKADHKKKQLEATMKFIQETPLPSQRKRKVLSKEGETERLLTLLCHDKIEKSGRKSKDHHDDSD